MADKSSKSPWQYSKAQENKYARQLRAVAKHSGAIIAAHTNADGELEDVSSMMHTANLYAAALEPWANRVAMAMIMQVAKSNERAWQQQSKIIGRELSKVLQTSNIAPTIEALRLENVKLIKSLPIEAANRASKLSQEAVTTGARADEIAAQIGASGTVTQSRATLIARTEIAKSNANITQARAGLIGSKSYIWRTMEDGAVREAHAEMANETFDFDDPPEVGDEGNHGPGEYPNCRCYAEVII